MTKPFKYQKEGVRLISHFGGRVLLADSMGLGKTIQALAWMKINKKRPTIVICPAVAKLVWEREAMKHFRIRTCVLEGRTPCETKHRNFFKTEPNVVVINYDILKEWVPHLRRLNPQLVILDECQAFKNPYSQRSRYMRKICEDVPHLLALSGTPFLNRPVELFNVVNLLWPDEFPRFREFAWRYCQPRWSSWGGWQYKGAVRLPELNKRLRRSGMVRRLKEDVLQDLPEKRRIVVPVELSNRKEYEYAETNFITWLGKKSKLKALKALRAQALVRFSYLKQLAAELKYDNVTKWIDLFLEGTDEKIVLFAVHREMIRKLHSRYPNSVFIDGSVTKRKRQYAIDKFSNNRKCRVFIGNIRAAGVAISLTAANTLAFVELGWTPGEHNQAEDRIHRIGQRNLATCYYLVTQNTIEEDLCKMLQKKQGVLKATLDGGRQLMDMDIFTQLTRKMKRRVL